MVESGRGLIGDSEKCYDMFEEAIIDRYEILYESEEAWMIMSFNFQEQEMPALPPTSLCICPWPAWAAWQGLNGVP